MQPDDIPLYGGESGEERNKLATWRPPIRQSNPTWKTVQSPVAAAAVVHTWAAVPSCQILPSAAADTWAARSAAPSSHSLP